MKKTSEQEWDTMISDDGFTFDDNSLGNVPSETSHCSSISDSSNEVEYSFEMDRHPGPKSPENKKKIKLKGDVNILEVLRQVTETVQRLERKVDNMQTVLTDLSRGRAIVKTCLNCDPSLYKKNVTQIKKGLKRDNSAKKKALTWRSGLGLPVTSVSEMDSVNKKLNTTEYLTEFKTLLRHCSARGIGLNEKLKLILKEALGNEVGGLYNLSGTCGKRSIEKTELFNVIQCYIMELYGATNETRRAVKLVFHRFLKNQQDRITKAAKCKPNEGSSSLSDCNGETSASNSGTLIDKTADVIISNQDTDSVQNGNSFDFMGKITEKDFNQCSSCDEIFYDEVLFKKHICNADNRDQVDDEMDSNADDSSYERNFRKYLLYDTVAWVNDGASSPTIITDDDLLQKDMLLKIDDGDEELITDDDALSIFRVKKEREELNASRIFASNVDDDFSDS